MAKQVRVALQSAERVASGARLIELAQPLSEQLAQEESERAFSELESLSSEPAPPAGYHKSAYVGMDEEGLKQIRALRDDLDELACIENLYERCLFPHCVQGAPRFGICDILDAGAPGDISVIA